MIAECAQNRKCEQTLLLFRDMRRVRVELDQMVLVAALSACAELGDVKLGRWIHWHVQQRFVARNQLQPVVRLSKALRHMYANCGIIDEAYQPFTMMPQKSTVSSILMAFAKHGFGKEALDLFKAMISDGVGVNEVRPDEITFIGVLCACSHAGLVHELVQELSKELVSGGSTIICCTTIKDVEQVSFNGNYSEYFGFTTDVDEVVYLMLVNDIIHGLFPEAILGEVDIIHESTGKVRVLKKKDIWRFCIGK